MPPLFAIDNAAPDRVPTSAPADTPANALAVFRPPEEGVRRWWMVVAALVLAVLAIAVAPVGQAAWQPLAPEPQKALPAPDRSAGVVAAMRRVALPGAGSGVGASALTSLEVPQPDPAATLQHAASGGDLRLAAPFRFNGTGLDRERAVQCLALAAWYEAGDDAVSQRSVIQVVLNRVAHPAFPKSVCGVVFQGAERRTGCQFTFTCDGSMIRRQPSVAGLARARALALAALSGAVDPSVMQATHYHADYVQPWWAPSLERLGVVGRHIFYRWGGARGNLLGKPRLALEGDPYALMSAPAPDAPSPGDTAPGEAGGDGQALLAMPVDPSTALAGFALAPLPAPPPTSTHFMQVDPSKASGRWAMNALDRCSGRATCQVVGYADAGEMARNRMLPSRARERPLFLFVRDGTSGMELAMWDCTRVQRPDARQCLPPSGPQLDRLTRDRGT